MKGTLVYSHDHCCGLTCMTHIPLSSSGSKVLIDVSTMLVRRLSLYGCRSHPRYQGQLLNAKGGGLSVKHPDVGALDDGKHAGVEEE